MDERLVIDLLEELFEGFGVQIRHEAIRQNEDSVFVSGGLCLLREKYVLIRNSSASAREKITVLATALKHLDFDNIYIRPVVTWERIDKTEKTSLKGAQKGVARKMARVF